MDSKKLELFLDLYKNTVRQGPGSNQDTNRALSYLQFPNHQTIRIADIGCGSGGQTLTLARELDCEITAVDLFPMFLKELKEKAKQMKVSHKIKTIEATMDDLPFAEKEFDLIWSEGAIYNIGFENGLQQWNKYLKTGGYLAVSEITWITQERPQELEDFWLSEYPEIDTASKKITQLENNGYSLVGYFYLSPDSWLKQYYEHLAEGFSDFLERNNHSELAKEVIQEQEAEIALYTKYQDYYSYGFYIARKN